MQWLAQDECLSTISDLRYLATGLQSHTFAAKVALKAGLALGNRNLA
jgi:hypothetical protein